MTEFEKWWAEQEYIPGRATMTEWKQFQREAWEAATKAEREACANACEGRKGTVSMFATSREAVAHNRCADECAKAIRSRGSDE